MLRHEDQRAWRVRTVALKAVVLGRYDAAAGTDPHSSRRLTREALRVQSVATFFKTLRHDNVIRLHDVVVGHIHNARVLALVIEYAPHGELFGHVIDHGGFPEVVARTFFRQLMDGLAYLHYTQRVVHRDLKPENILLGRDFVLKIADLGYARKLASEAELFTTKLGTDYYKAPELYGSPDATYEGRPIDVWSCGVILFAMLAINFPCEYATYPDPWFAYLAAGRLREFWDYWREEVGDCARGAAGHAWKGEVAPWEATIEQVEEYIRRHPRESVGRARGPPIFSYAAINLLARMLTVNPSQRITVEEIARHPWVTMGPVLPQHIVASYMRNEQPDLSTGTALGPIAIRRPDAEVLKSSSTVLPVSPLVVHSDGAQGGPRGEVAPDGASGAAGTAAPATSAKGDASPQTAVPLKHGGMTVTSAESVEYERPRGESGENVSFVGPKSGGGGGGGTAAHSDDGELPGPMEDIPRGESNSSYAFAGEIDEVEDADSTRSPVDASNPEAPDCAAEGTAGAGETRRLCARVGADGRAFRVYCQNANGRAMFRMCPIKCGKMEAAMRVLQEACADTGATCDVLMTDNGAVIRGSMPKSAIVAAEKRTKSSPGGVDGRATPPSGGLPRSTSHGGAGGDESPRPPKSPKAPRHGCCVVGGGVSFTLELMHVADGPGFSVRVGRANKSAGLAFFKFRTALLARLERHILDGEVDMKEHLRALRESSAPDEEYWGDKEPTTVGIAADSASSDAAHAARTPTTPVGAAASPADPL